jgi:nitrous oxide reductase accessory protein NosL
MERVIDVKFVEVVKDKREGYNVTGIFAIGSYGGILTIPFISKEAAEDARSHVFGEFAPKGGGSEKFGDEGEKTGC